MPTISRELQLAVREALVGFTLGQIDVLFEGAGLKPGKLRPDRNISGQRRTRVEEFYAEVNWASPTDQRRVLRVIENFLMELPEGPDREKILKNLTRDGYRFENNSLIGPAGLPVWEGPLPSKALDAAVFADHLRRIESGLAADPAQAIGSAKELLESVAKGVLEAASIDHTKFDTLPRLVKEAMRSIGLDADAIADAQKGAAAIKMALGGLSQVIHAVAELRNLYGTGHGKARRTGVTARHARLAVSSSSALALFILETHAERSGIRPSSTSSASGASP